MNIFLYFFVGILGSWFYAAWRISRGGHFDEDDFWMLICFASLWPLLLFGFALFYAGKYTVAPLFRKTVELMRKYQ